MKLIANSFWELGKNLFMRGEKTYTLAEIINKKLYQNSSSLDYAEKELLYKQYLNLIRRSAYLDYSEALYELGLQYENISYLGVPNPMYSPKKCIYWFSKACSKGHAEACNNLATFYEKGEGCKKDLDLALKLYERSSSLGSLNGKNNYKIMIKDLQIGGRYYSL